MRNLKTYHFIGIAALLVLFLFPLENTHAQDSAGKLKRRAETLLKKGDIYGAIPLLERYCIKKPDDIKMAYKLAHDLSLIRDYTKSADWYLKVYNMDKVNYREALYYHARMLKMSGANESALKNFNEFKRIYKGFDTDRDLKKLLDAEIAGCMMADSLYKNKTDIMINLLDTSVNKVYSEFSPFMINDSTLLYATLPTNKVLEIDEQKPSKRFFIATKKDYQWTGGQEFEGPFNSLDATTGNGCFSPDQSRFYFTRCVYNFDNDLICGIYVSSKKEGKWTDPERLGNGINSASYTSTHPAVGRDPKSPDKEVLYFISNRPNGEGSYDIWYSTYDKRKKEYDEPKNIGKKLNTVGDEFSLFVDNNNSRLYFASTGWPGIGGFDLFKSNGYKRSWTEPENLGYPFNSNADDLYYTRGTETKDGFFVSNRNGGYAFSYYNCCDDIYEFRWKEYINVFVRGSIAAQVSEMAEEGLPPLENPVVLLYIFDQNSKETVLLRSDTITDGDFELELEPGELYQVMVKADKYLNKSFNVSTVDYFLSDTLNFDFKLDIIPDKPIVLENILFDFDSDKLRPEVMAYLDSTLYQMMSDNPDIRIEISAHSDSKGNDDYNLTLSQRRASSVGNYMISRGIEKRRIKARGYGEQRPIAPNKNDDGTDNPEGRALNRRVEFEILK